MSNNHEDRSADAEEKLRKSVNAVYDVMKEMSATLPPEAGASIRSVIEFRKALTNETDRGAVLMAAAFIDDQLKVMLAGKLVDDKKISRRAFDFNGPLGTFSSRIDFSYLLGILPKNARKDLHAIRAIRNKFAHSAAPLTYEHVTIKPLCDALVFHGVKPVASAGSKFRRTAMGLLALITDAIGDAVHIEACVDYVIPDRKDAYKLVANIYESINGTPYPLKHEHEE